MSITENSITLEQLLQEIRLNRNEIINKIEESETKLFLTVNSMANKIKELERENSLLKEQVEQLKRGSSENNIVIFGLNIPTENFTVENICHQLEELLEIQVNVSDINKTYKLGKDPASPIKVEFLGYLKKQEILKNCHKLKGKKISVVSDLTRKQREEGKILRHHMFLAKKDKNTCYIKNSKLYINGTPYSPQDLIQSEEEVSDNNRPNSDRTTPLAYLNRTKQAEVPINIQIATISAEKSTSPQTLEAEIKKRNTRQNPQSQVGKHFQERKTKTQSTK